MGTDVITHVIQIQQACCARRASPMLLVCCPPFSGHSSALRLPRQWRDCGATWGMGRGEWWEANPLEVQEAEVTKVYATQRALPRKKAGGPEVKPQQELPLWQQSRAPGPVRLSLPCALAECWSHTPSSKDWKQPTFGKSEIRILERFTWDRSIEKKIDPGSLLEEVVDARGKTSGIPVLSCPAS